MQLPSADELPNFHPLTVSDARLLPQSPSSIAHIIASEQISTESSPQPVFEPLPVFETLSISDRRSTTLHPQEEKEDGEIVDDSPCSHPKKKAHYDDILIDSINKPSPVYKPYRFSRPGEPTYKDLAAKEVIPFI